MGKRLKWVKNKPVAMSDAFGFVERISSSEVVGWAVSRTGADVDLALRIDDATFTMVADWTEREDVTSKIPLNKNARVGFAIQPSGSIRECITQALRTGCPLNVLANGVALPHAKSSVHAPRHAPIVSAGKSKVEDFKNFIISGWAVSGDKPVNTFGLICNGKAVDCTVVRKERRDVAEALQIDALETGFDIELPGYIWENATGKGACRLEILGDGVVLTSKLLEVDRKKAGEWMTHISWMEENSEKQYFALLALEHVRYGNLFSDLDDTTGQFVKRTAAQMKLESFVFAETDDDLPANEAPSENLNDLLLWKALKELNARLDGARGGAFQHVKAVLDEKRLIRDIRNSYLLAAVPLLCRQKEFLEMRVLTNFESLYHLEKSHNLWEMSLAVAPLVADQNISRATELLWKVSRNLNAGWLCTECIRFAVDHVQELEAEGKVDLPVAEKFRYAFLGLMDSFKGDWFSRLHDRELIDATVTIIRDIDRCTNYQKIDIVRAGIRHYGLCPTFWQRLTDRLPVEIDEELSQAWTAWSRLHAALVEDQVPLSERIDALLEPILFFHRHGNPETRIFLREIVAKCLPDLNRNLSPAGRRLIDILLELHPLDALRIAAFPLADSNTLQPSFPELGSRLFHKLREMGERDKSSVYDLQIAASASLRAAREASRSGDREAIRKALAEMERRAIALTNWPGNFLGADLLACAYILAAEAKLETDLFLIRLREIVQKVALEVNDNWYLPPSVCSALGRLMQQSGDAVLRGFLMEIQALIRNRFGLRHDALFSLKPVPAHAMATQYWPHDTLVVIYSCRKYLDTRVQAIRETWVRDLNARGIPYMVVVGDGDDKLRDDVLYLDVSDKYEDLPRKTLKLFHWVYRNTDAQYVLKIDDDCYLDVDRYFDTLSYRKFFYYGRIIKHGIGGMVRTWHQPKSHSPHGQKTIDKSPEPSVWADGGGGYCLSRFAIHALLEARKTIAGKQLISRSFMEDKLVGDLLALSYILPSDEDYESCQRRRTHAGAIPVSMVENTFFPCRATPTKVVHLDSEQHLLLSHEKAKGNELWPKKIWPTCGSPYIKRNSNQLELLSEPEMLPALLAEPIAVVSVMRNEMIMLPHFLGHYRAMGVRAFIVVDNCSDDGTREYLLKQPDVVLYSADTEYRHSNYGVSWQQAVLGNLCLGKWVLLADADELLVFEGCEHREIAEFIAEVEAGGADAVRTDMIDMYPYDDLSNADFKRESPFNAAPWFDEKALIPWHLGSGMFNNGPAFVNHLRHRMLCTNPHDFVAGKIALFRHQPWVRLSQGVHYAANQTVSSFPAWFAHFKYHSAFKDKVLTEIRRGQHFNNASEYRRYVAMLAEGRGGFGKKGVSVHYDSSSSFVALRRGNPVDTPGA